MKDKDDNVTHDFWEFQNICNEVHEEMMQQKLKDYIDLCPVEITTNVNTIKMITIALEFYITHCFRADDDYRKLWETVSSDYQSIVLECYNEYEELNNE